MTYKSANPPWAIDLSRNSKQNQPWVLSLEIRRLLVEFLQVQMHQQNPGPALRRLLTHRGKTLAHDEVPLVFGEYSDVLVQTRPAGWATEIIVGPLGSVFALRPFIIWYTLYFSRVTDSRVDVHF